MFLDIKGTVVSRVTTPVGSSFSFPLPTTSPLSDARLSFLFKCTPLQTGDDASNKSIVWFTARLGAVRRRGTVTGGAPAVKEVVVRQVTSTRRARPYPSDILFIYTPVVLLSCRQIVLNVWQIILLINPKIRMLEFLHHILRGNESLNSVTLSAGRRYDRSNCKSRPADVRAQHTGSRRGSPRSRYTSSSSAGARGALPLRAPVVLTGLRHPHAVSPHQTHK